MAAQRRSRRWLATLVVAAVALIATAVWLWYPTPGGPGGERATMHRMYPIDGDEQAAVVLDGQTQRLLAVNPHGAVLWSTPPTQMWDQNVGCGQHCDQAVLSSSVNYWHDLSHPDPLPRTLSAAGERTWSLPATQKMRVLAGGSEDDALVLRVDRPAGAWVEIRRPGQKPETVALPTANVEWSPSPDRQAGVLFEYNAQSGSSTLWRFSRSATGWSLRSTDTVPSGLRGACVDDTADRLVTLAATNDIVAHHAGRDLRLDSDLRGGECVVTAHGYVLIQHVARGAARTTSVRAHTFEGALAWRSDSPSEVFVSAAAASGAVLISDTRETVLRQPDGSQRQPPVPADTAATFGRRGSLILLDQRAGGARPAPAETLLSARQPD